jgi:hypothetical protein
MEGKIMLIKIITLLCMPIFLTAMQEHGPEGGLPAGWEQKALEQFPPLFKYFYIQQQKHWPTVYFQGKSILSAHESYARVFNIIGRYYKNEVVTIQDFIDAQNGVKFLCQVLHISPQSTVAIGTAFYDIIQNKKIDLTDPSLRFDQAVEQQNKVALIARMPRMMCDICIKSLDTYAAEGMMEALYYRNTQVFSVSTALYSMHGEYWSPQTINRLIKNFSALIENKPVYFDFSYPRNSYVEEENILTILATCPPSIVQEYYHGDRIFLHGSNSYVLHHRYFNSIQKKEGNSIIVSFKDEVIKDMHNHIQILLHNEQQTTELEKQFIGGPCTSPQIERMKEFFLCVPEQHKLPVELSYKIFESVNKLPYSNSLRKYRQTVINREISCKK